MADFLLTNSSVTLRQWLRGSLARVGLSLSFVGLIWYLSGLALRLEAGASEVFWFLLLLLILVHAAATWLLARQVGALMELADNGPDNPWLLELAASAWWILLLLLIGALLLSDLALLLFACVVLCPQPNSGPIWFT